MNYRSKIKSIIGIGLIGCLLGFALYTIHQRQGKADDILTMQGVGVCSTSRDFQAGKHGCPSQDRYVTTCDEAKAAVTALPGIKLASESSEIATDNRGDCQLKTVNEQEGLYALIVNTYYPVTVSPSQPLNDHGIRSRALDQLYDTYSNLYQSYQVIDLSTVSVNQGITQSSLVQKFTPAFLVKGEPGFLMTVQMEDQQGVTAAGAGTKIVVSCGDAHDTMVTEPNGTSWFSFKGYEQLDCGNQPLFAQAVVEKDGAGHWIENTASYNYLYTPALPVPLNTQNRPQPAQVSFTGKWQGIGIQVQVSSTDLDGHSHVVPLEKAKVRFTCGVTQLLSPSPYSTLPTTSSPITLEQITDAKGRASIALAEAQSNFPGCPTDKFVTFLSGFDSQTGAAENDPAYDYYFTSTGPAPAGRVEGGSTSGTVLSGNELTVAGKVQLQSIGKIPGGFFTSGSLVCLFYSEEAAAAVSGCPTENSTQSMTVRSGKTGQYLFGNDAATHLSYGDYLKRGAGKIVLRIVNYKNEAYPPEVIAGNLTPLDPKQLNRKDIVLPTSEADLQNHVCLAVQQEFHDANQCAALLNIIFRESRWDVDATNPSSGACGLFQSNPCSKYQGTALPGEDYRSIGNQIRWGVQYIKSRYGTPNEAWAFWQAHNHY